MASIKGKRGKYSSIPLNLPKKYIYRLKKDCYYGGHE